MGFTIFHQFKDMFFFQILIFLKSDCFLNEVLNNDCQHGSGLVEICYTNVSKIVSASPRSSMDITQEFVRNAKS